MQNISEIYYLAQVWLYIIRSVSLRLISRKKMVFVIYCLQLIWKRYFGHSVCEQNNQIILVKMTKLNLYDYYKLVKLTFIYLAEVKTKADQMQITIWNWLQPFGMVVLTNLRLVLV